MTLHTEFAALLARVDVCQVALAHRHPPRAAVPHRAATRVAAGRAPAEGVETLVEEADSGRTGRSTRPRLADAHGDPRRLGDSPPDGKPSCS